MSDADDIRTAELAHDDMVDLGFSEAEANAAANPTDADYSSTANPAELAMLLEQRAEPWIAANGGGYSLAIVVTDGDKPGAGTTVSIRSGRYAHDTDVLSPDEQAAYDQRLDIRAAIVDHLGDLSQEGVDPDALTDDIVAALAGE